MSNGDICCEAGQGKESDGDVALDLRWDHQQGPFDKGTLSRAWRKQEGALLGPGKGVKFQIEEIVRAKAGTLSGSQGP